MKILNFKSNLLESLENVLEALNRNLELSNLDLRNNPLTLFPDYQKRLQGLIIRLEVFDKRLVKYQPKMADHLPKIKKITGEYFFSKNEQILKNKVHKF